MLRKVSASSHECGVPSLEELSGAEALLSHLVERRQSEVDRDRSDGSSGSRVGGAPCSDDPDTIDKLVYAVFNWQPGDVLFEHEREQFVKTAKLEHFSFFK